MVLPVELRQLRYFCAVAEELSFARAARRLFIAQPALSIQIRHLEEELKVLLLRRTTRSVEITHAGRAFYQEASEVLARVDAAGKHAQDAAQGIVGHLRVAFAANVATADLGRRIREFSVGYPLVNLLLREASTADQIQMLRHGEIDVGLLRISRLADGRGQSIRPGEFAVRAGFSGDELTSEEVGRELMIVAVPANGPLASKKRLDWTDFHDQPMIGSSDPRERYFESFFACCERVRVRAVVSQYAQDLLTRLWMVACGFGYTPTSAASQEISRPGLAYRPLPSDGPEVFTLAAWRRNDPPPQVLHFIKALKAAKYS